MKERTEGHSIPKPNNWKNNIKINQQTTRGEMVKIKAERGK